MIFEFVGLPGSGKSTIFTAAADRLHQAGLQTTTMRMLAKHAVETDHRKIGFLRRRVERASLYGAMAFGQDYPRIFDLLIANARGDLSTGLWNMEMLSHLHFAGWCGLPDHPVFMDEGFLHRGAATFLLTRDEAGFRDYLGMIPRSHCVIHVAASVELAVDRAQGRKLKKRVPAAWLGGSEHEMLDNLRYFGGLVTLGCDLLRKRGVRVIELDARQPVAATASRLAETVIELQSPTSDAEAVNRVA